MGLTVLDGIGPKKRARMGKLGKQFSSDQARDTASDQLAAVKAHPIMKDFGIDDGDVALMTAWLRATDDGLTAVKQAGTAKKVTNVAWANAMLEAKAARRALLGLLGKGARKLRDSETDESEALAERVAAALEKNRRAGGDSELLGAQLAQLRALTDEAPIAAVLDATQLARVNGQADAARTALENASKTDARRGGTENEDADVLDGLIVELAREWRGLARTASAETGSPALADAFELRRLYPDKHGKKPQAPA